MKEMEELEAVMRRLRDPEKGCPWDKVQTHATLKQSLIGEAAEYLDSVDAGDDAGMREELGDLLMQIVLNSVMAEERGAFTLRDVTKDVTEKMIRRHPHVFGDAKAENADQVLNIWQNVKKQEHAPAEFTSVLSRIPRNLPALARAHKIQKKAAETGFDWTDEAGVIAKLREEVAEAEEALASGDDSRIADELGDLLFTVVNLARFRKKESAEDMLRKASDKFSRRFRYIEKKLAQEKRSPGDASPEELDLLWNEAKKTGL